MEKQKIYVTQEMKSALELDAKNFEITKEDGSSNMNAFLKMLITNYYPDYNTRKLSIYNDTLIEIQKSTDLDEYDANELTDNLVSLYNGVHPNNYYLTGSPSESITLSTSGDISYLIGNITDDHPSKTLSQYLRYMFSSYLTLSRNIREQIVFKPLYNALLEHIKQEQVIKFTTKKKNSKTENNYHNIYPYKIVSSKDASYNYLLGFDIDENKTYTFRLSRITGLLCAANNNHKITLEERVIEKLEKAAIMAPQFSFNDAAEIVVAFTEEGKRKYEMIYTNRPVLISKDGDNYHFEWPEEPFFEYIIRFGKEAKVLKPQSLIDKIKQYHYEAFRVY